jgi:hypothetical protein
MTNAHGLKAMTMMGSLSLPTCYYFGRRIEDELPISLLSYGQTR